MNHQRQELVQECDQQLRAVVPELPRPEQKALAAAVSGVVLSGHAQLSQLSAASPGRAQDRSKQRRVQRLLANARLDLARAQRRLLQRVLCGRRGRLDLLLDATTTGASAAQHGTVTVCFALAWHHRALPLLWRTWPAAAPGQGWAVAIGEMAATIQAALPTDGSVQVVLLADRGLSGSTLARLAVAHGWHYLLRVTRHTRLRLPDGTLGEVGALLPLPGTHCCLAHVQLYAPRRKAGAGAGGWRSDWEHALTAQVVAVWRRQEEEAWLLVTDLPASVGRCSEYRRRTWQEELFRDLKGMGWQWQSSRVRQPERVARLVLVLALATLWMAALAQRVLRRGWRVRVEERCRRCYSVFQLGLRYLRRCLATDAHVPITFHLWPDCPAHVLPKLS